MLFTELFARPVSRVPGRAELRDEAEELCFAWSPWGIGVVPVWLQRATEVVPSLDGGLWGERHWKQWERVLEERVAVYWR